MPDLLRRRRHTQKGLRAPTESRRQRKEGLRSPAYVPAGTAGLGHATSATPASPMGRQRPYTAAAEADDNRQTAALASTASLKCPSTPSRPKMLSYTILFWALPKHVRRRLGPMAAAPGPGQVVFISHRPPTTKYSLFALIILQDP